VAAREAQAHRQRVEAEEQKRLESERRAQAEADLERTRLEAERTRAAADAAVAQAARDKEAAQAQIERANQAAQQANQAAEQARLDQVRLREQLVQEFNRVLETRESARGLIVNMSGVWFDTGKATLKPGAREKLSKIAAILAAHRNLKLEVEGHTDNTGSQDLNQELSERRADAVRDYLVQEGVNSTAITARGMGEGQPVASNDSAAGRQLNRRVEMVVSGDIIGTSITPAPTSSLR
jgi:outer membrane protein OmpA-like peptidoglycan-associated protein